MPATPIAACDATTVTLPDGRVVVSFGGCNYLGLANHPGVIGAVIEAAARFGLSSTASRETTGNAEPHEALERELAAFLDAERALLVPDGYLANIVACQGLAAAGCTVALLDGRAHVSMSDAARTAGLELAFFDHADPVSLVRTLEAVHGGRADRSAGGVVVMTDGVFTADGEPAPVLAYLRALGPADRLLIDDCHGLGVVGPGGRGSASHAGAADARIVITSSLAKGLGCAGGVVAGSRVDVARFAESAAYVCTTPIAPAMAEGTRAALAILQAEPARVERVAANARRLRAGLGRLGVLSFPTAQSVRAIPIASFTLGDLQTMRRLESGLLEDGFRVPLIRYPGGPAKAYFRLSVNAEHTPEQIDRLLGAVAARMGGLVAGTSALQVQAVDTARSRLTG